jgi:hypothetical protein
VCDNGVDRENYIYIYTGMNYMKLVRVATFRVRNKEAMGQVFIPVLGFSPVGIIITRSSAHHRRYTILKTDSIVK